MPEALRVLVQIFCLLTPVLGLVAPQKMKVHPEILLKTKDRFSTASSDQRRAP
jgi:hypothetical protein